jgi:hypothetical protein
MGTMGIKKKLFSTVCDSANRSEEQETNEADYCKVSFIYAIIYKSVR